MESIYLCNESTALSTSKHKHFVLIYISHNVYESHQNPNKYLLCQFYDVGIFDLLPLFPYMKLTVLSLSSIILPEFQSIFVPI